MGAASLFYYKGYLLRDRTARPNICAWFDGLESRNTYLGTQSDYHTHSHDLPPQLGGCYFDGPEAERHSARRIDLGPWDATLPDTGLPEPKSATAEAVFRVSRHKDSIISVNPTESQVVDEALRIALTSLIAPPGEDEEPLPMPSGKKADVALRYIRDRISVPRDMSVWAARRLKTALETTAARCGKNQGPPIPTRHRRDTDGRAFRKKAAKH